MKSVYLGLVLEAVGVIGLLVLCAASQPAEEPQRRPAPLSTRLYPVHVERVIDGDTLIGTIELGWGVALYHVRIRAATYDAWERTRRRRTVTITDEELRKGEEAAHSLELALQSARLYAGQWVNGRDRYGRVLAVLWIDRQGRLERLRDWMQRRGYLRQEVKQ